jgi:hypothetical protein
MKFITNLIAGLLFAVLALAPANSFAGGRGGGGGHFGGGGGRMGAFHGGFSSGRTAGSATEGAVRWFQAVDHLPVTGQIDSSTRQALGIA